ncbi:hypothetical protein KBC55_01400 [Patescibacteria group bacterium]|nr:hypothetical protein [Patescibacteria group bacterium]
MDQTTQPAPQGQKKGLSTSTKVIIGVLVAMVLFGMLAIIGGAIVIMVVAKNIKEANMDSYTYSDWEYTSYDDASTSWTPYTDTFGRFSGSFPAYPTYETDSTPITGSDVLVWYDMYSSEDLDGYYSITVSEYPVEIDLGEPEANLNNALDGLLASTGASLVTSGFESVEGNTALYYLASTSDGIYLEGKSIVQGQVLYQLMVAYEDEAASAEGREQFFSSFELNQ